MSTPWTSAEKVLMRKYIGFPSTFHQFEPRLENAFTAVQAQTDGGALPDDATQVDMRLTMTKLAAIDTQIEGLYCSLAIGSVGAEKVVMDPARAILFLENQGRKLIHRLCIPLGCRIVDDYYCPGEKKDYMDPNPFVQRDL